MTDMPSSTARGPRARQAVILAMCLLVAATLIWLDAWPPNPPASPLDQQRYAEGQHILRSLAAKVRAYARRTGRLPASLDDLVPDYLPEVPRDPWGRPYAYRRWPSGERADLGFRGRDGVFGKRMRQVDRDVYIFVTLPP